MADILVAPAPEPTPNRKRWTRQECERLAKAGFLTGRYELIDGEVISKMGQNPPHHLGIMLLNQWLSPLFGVPFVRIQGPIRIVHPEGDYNEPEPDVAVTRESSAAYADRHPGPEDLRLVVEVSDSTLRFDLTAKALLYARAGVPEMWVLDLENRCLYCHRRPTAAGYAEVILLTGQESVTLADFPETPCCILDLLPPPVA